MFSTAYLDQFGLCRICLIRERVNIPIFEEHGNFPQISLKINTCLPIKVAKEDKLPKKICVDCFYKLETFYQFYNVSANAEKQLLSWLGDRPAEAEGEEKVHLNKKLQQKGKTNNKPENPVSSVNGETLVETVVTVPDENVDLNHVFVKEEVAPTESINRPGVFEESILSKYKVDSLEEEDDEEEDDEDDEDYDPGTSGFQDEVNNMLEVALDEDENKSCIEEKPKKKAAQKSTEKKFKIKKTSKSSKKKIGNRRDSGEPKPRIRKITKNHKIAGKIFYKQLGPGNLACLDCDEKFALLKDVRTHFKEKHVVQQIFKCDQCEETFPKLCQFKVHRKVHGIDMNAPVFYCDKCDYKSQVKYYYEAHYARKHTDVYKFDCDICGKKFKLKEDIRMHVGIHDDEQHMCDICGRFYPTQLILNKHRRVKHINTYEFRCPICRLKFISQLNLDNHIRENHNPDNPHKCNECGLQFKRKYYLNRHERRVHKKLEKPYLCTLCGKSFVCMNTYRIHYLTHTKIRPYVCNVCGDTFSQRSSMMLHWKKRHPDAGEPPPPVILTNVFETLHLDQGDNPDLTAEMGKQLYQPTF